MHPSQTWKLRCALALATAAVATQGACGSSGTEQGAQSAGTGQLLTGAGGALATDVASSSSTGFVSHAGGGGAGGAPEPPHGPYPIVLAHGFFGFNDFAGQGFLTYFYQVKDTLAAEGIDVYTPEVDPFNDSDARGAELLVAIKQILADTGAAKVNIIGHSQGGLDARVVANLRPDLVASVVTVAAPHNGTPVADVVLQLVSDPNLQDAVDELVQIIGAPLYDQVGNESSVFKPLRLFSQPGITAFNAAHPDEPSVFYASLAGRSADADNGDDCRPDVLLSFVAQYDDDTDPVDPALVATELICANGFDNIINDGLVRARDAKRGQFWGCVPADHLDEVGQLFGDDPGLLNPFDYMQLYRDLIHEIRNLGY